MIPYTFRKATNNDWPQIAALLGAAELPLAGAEAHRAEFLLAFQGTALVGTVMLERYEETALLRSVAVDQHERGNGLGQALVRQALDQAQRAGLKQVVLLTTTAEGFFPRFGFRTILRADVPLAAQASIEFQEACPSSATVMSLLYQPEEC
jgi:amino-acid N-acetyltransferase